MEVKAKIKFFDREADTLREKDITFEVQKARGEKLIKLGYVEELKEDMETKTTKKTTNKTQD